MTAFAKEWSFRRVVAIGTGMGLLSFAAMLLFDHAISAGILAVPTTLEYDLKFVVLLILFFLPPILVQSVFYRRLWRLRRGLLLGVSCGIGWFLGMLADVLPTWLTSTNAAQGRATHADWIVHFASYMLLILASASAVSFLAWTANRLIRGKPVVLDTPLCPHCEYSLRGNSSGTCPECGASATSPGQAAQR